MFFIISIILSLQPQTGYAKQLTALTSAQIDYRRLPLNQRQQFFKLSAQYVN